MKQKNQKMKGDDTMNEIKVFTKTKTWFQNHKEGIVRTAKTAGGIVLFFGAICSIIAGSKDEINFDKWLKTATDEELANDYENRRQECIKNGTEPTSPEMRKINNEMNERDGKRWENDPRRNKDPNFHWTDAARWEKD